MYDKVNAGKQTERVKPVEQDKKSVAVLMSTYNGENFLLEQLDSIFEQKGVQVQLFVRDDGSSDSTLSILKKYAETYPLTVIRDNERLGPGNSFMKLVYEVTPKTGADYFAFADQDDVWLPDKLIKGINSIEKYAEETPVLYSSNQFLFKNGENIGLRYSTPLCPSLTSELTRNLISGCTFVFNRALADLINEREHADQRILKYRLHDSWLMLVAITKGIVVYDETPKILYRIHQSNTVGLKGVSMKKRLGRLQRFFVKRDDSNLRMLTAQQLLRSFPEITGEMKEVLKLFANYQNSMNDKLKLAFNSEIRRDCGENANVFSLKVLLNYV